MPKMIFVNLPVSDIAASTEFYTAIGCQKNDMFSDEKASSMMWTDNITIQLLAKDYFQTFTTKAVADAKTSTEVLIALSADSREDVDAIAERGGAAHGNANFREPVDMGFLYQRAIKDPDGHIVEIGWMDMSAMPSE